jgi:hypothetical protein
MEKLTFPQRVRSMQAAVEHLRALLVIVEQEAEAMAEVQKRFAAKKPGKDGSISLPPPRTAFQNRFISPSLM